MSGLILSLIRDGVELFVRGRMARQAVRHGIGTMVFYGVLAILGLGALIFFYLALYDVLARATDGPSAAAILCAGSVLAMGAALLGRAIVKKSRGAPRVLPDELAGRFPELDDILAVVRELEKELRKAAPEMTIAAAVIGLMVGANPGILNLLIPRRRDAEEPDARARKKGR